MYNRMVAIVIDFVGRAVVAIAAFLALWRFPVGF